VVSEADRDRAVRELLERDGVRVARLKLLKAEPALVYRVRGRDGTDAVVRVRPVGGELSGRMARLQHRWMSSLAAATPPLAPKPLLLAGEPFQWVKLPGEPRRRQVAMVSWTDGRRAKDAAAFVESRRLAAVGRATAQLHRHAQSFRVGRSDGVRRFEAAHFFGGETCVGSLGRRLFAAADFKLLRYLAGVAGEAMADVGDGRSAFGLIHADLEPPNWLFRGRATPIDFESFGLGHYLFDCVQVLWTHGMWPGYPDYRDVFLRAYESVRPLTAKERRHLPAFEMLPLIEWITRALRRRHENNGDELRRWLPPTIKRLRELATDDQPRRSPSSKLARRSREVRRTARRVQ